MIPRERYLRTMTFQPVDRVPLIEWPIRGATMARWIGEGYPEGIDPQTFFSLDTNTLEVPVNLGMHPKFEPQILSEDQNYKIWRDELGATRKDFAKDATPGFVTRSWLRFAVEKREDFERMKKRYIAAQPERYAPDFAKRAHILNQGVAPVQMVIPYLFWTTRDWVGFENLCMMFYDDPGLVKEMFAFITDFVIETLRPVIDSIDIDVVELKEDMAYKHAPMISPAMFKEFMYPQYVRLISFLKSHSAKLVFVDCDGYPGNELTALWLDAGVDAVSPCEIAAGNDLIQLRKDFPKLGMYGGIDKRVLAQSKEAIDREVLGKVPWLLERGGYIPHVDHAVPHDVPLENYIYYRKLLTRVVCGG